VGDDAETYSCVATNVAGSQHRDVELVVQGESEDTKPWQWGGEGGRGNLILNTFV
jgi:hypothetical protein